METSEPIPPYITDRLKLIVGLGATHVEEAKSAQQRVLIFHYGDSPTRESKSKHGEGLADVSPLRGVLESGGNCLVVRIWRGGSRWWNLTQAKDVQALAAAELQGYQWAHKALGSKVPKLLYASKEDESPWALFEYVGHKSNRFNDKSYVYDQYWTEIMIKVRDEFGFHELHPRWGRVPVEESLDYTKRVLHQVTIPLHQYFYQNEHVVGSDEVQLLCGDLRNETSGYTYIRMVQRYGEAFITMKESLECATNKDPRLSQAIVALEKCIEELEKEHVPPLPCVLVHMDCQPQNLVFAKTLNEEDPWCVSSVLDWEDCAYGDPRFELLLLGRKVCANRRQAELLWDDYRKYFPDLELGRIETWLRLETVHSLCTLLLQSMDLLGGGRSPWETKPDLYGKIEREFSRLVFTGWTFCQSVAAAVRD